MDRSRALILAFLLTFTLFLTYSSIYNSPEREVVLVGRVIDGDTLETDKGEKLRLLNINTPEKNEPGFIEAKSFLQEYENEIIAVEKIGQDKYQRTLARAYTLDNTPIYLNLELIKKGLAKSFLVQAEEKKEFKQAEFKAIKSEEGNWKLSSSFGCLQAKIDKVKEVVKIQNSCKTLKSDGITVKDESRKEYIFKIPSFSSINLHSGVGEDNETDIFWNNKQNVWNNDADSIYIHDKNNNIIYFDSYGY